MTTQVRRYDIDWLRVIAIGFLIIYHIAVAFQPWGVFIGFIQSEHPLESLWIPMSMLNIWRIPLLFFVSGMGVCFAIRRRSWKELILERTRRILVPFLFGMFAIVPLHIFVWQKYYSQDIAYVVHPSHLWFLANIFIYVVLFAPLFFYLKWNGNGKINRRLKNLMGSPAGLLLITATFVIEVAVVRPESYETYSMTVHGFLLGLLAFVFGYLLVYSGERYWKTVLTWRWLLLSLGITLFLVRVIGFQFQSPNYLKAIETCIWIFAAFGFGYKHLNRPSRALRYLSQAAYPVYIIHMIMLYLFSILIFPLSLPAYLKFILIMFSTTVGCVALYDMIIRRIRFLRPLFGLRTSHELTVKNR